MKKLFYFAYGSNLLLAQMKERIQDFTKEGTHTLKGYKLAFNCGSNKQPSTANIVKGTNEDFVEGVLYELPDEEIYYMDKFEGVPYCYVKRYFDLPNGNLGFVYISESKFRQTNALPSVKYLNRIIDGALENNLLYTYNLLVQYKTNILKVSNNRHKVLRHV